nr:thrombospondin type 3 repeat-containing protein [Deltaproteobacteria bacterium]
MPDRGSGEHPDPRRAGCPADSDGDGVFDHEDACATVAAGPTPDPDRRGCPDGDEDNDSVRNHADQCRRSRGSDARPPARVPGADRDNDAVPDTVDACPTGPGAPATPAERLPRARARHRRASSASTARCSSPTTATGSSRAARPSSRRWPTRTARSADPPVRVEGTPRTGPGRTRALPAPRAERRHLAHGPRHRPRPAGSAGPRPDARARPNITHATGR